MISRVLSEFVTLMTILSFFLAADPCEVMALEFKVLTKRKITNDIRDQVTYYSCTTNCNRIIYSHSKSGNFEIVSINADGTGKKILTSSGYETRPCISPDGKKIAYLKQRGLSYDIWIMDQNGSNKKQLTIYGGPEGIAWFPDSKRILCSVYNDFFVIDVEGSEIINFELSIRKEGMHSKYNLTRGKVLSALTDPNPTFSPGGEKIVYTGVSDGQYDIWIMNSDGSQHLNLTNTRNDSEKSPFWSPEGNRIGFRVLENLWVMNADGSGKFKLDNIGKDYLSIKKVLWFPSHNKNRSMLFYDLTDANEIWNIYSTELELLLK